MLGAISRQRTSKSVKVTYLRGTIENDLQDRITGGFTADNFQLIRFHGMYQQDDRDIRNERAKQKLEPLHNVMLRARMPGGIITPKQWLAIDKFATEITSVWKYPFNDASNVSVSWCIEAKYQADAPNAKQLSVLILLRQRVT